MYRVLQRNLVLGFAQLLIVPLKLNVYSSKIMHLVERIPSSYTCIMYCLHYVVIMYLMERSPSSYTCICTVYITLCLLFWEHCMLRFKCDVFMQNTFMLHFDSILLCMITLNLIIVTVTMYQSSDFSCSANLSDFVNNCQH